MFYLQNKQKKLQKHTLHKPCTLLRPSSFIRPLVLVGFSSLKKLFCENLTGFTYFFHVFNQLLYKFQGFLKTPNSIQYTRKKVYNLHSSPPNFSHNYMALPDVARLLLYLERHPVFVSLLHQGGHDFSVPFHRLTFYGTSRDFFR